MRNRKIAYIDLSSGTIRVDTIPEEMRRLFIGGRGIDMYLLYNHVKPGIDAFSPENVLLFSAGLLSGTTSPASSRSHVGGKSPQTGLLGSSNMGGFFAPELRFAGYDHLVVKGKADHPVYIWINNDKIEIRDARSLWGQDTFDTPELIRKELGDPDIKVACIGISGEKLVRFANVRTGMKSCAGRTGMGAVMGSKNLKAVAVRGTEDIPIAHPEEALAYYKELVDRVMSTRMVGALSKMGTMFIYGNTNTTGLIRTRNFQLNQLADSEGLEAENMDKFAYGMSACFGCTVHCRHKYLVPEGPDAGKHAEGPEYTSQGAFGTEVDVRRLEVPLTANHWVNKYGIDTLEMGNAIGCAMEMYEKGIINIEDTDGIKLEWGNEEAVIEMVHRISKREGFGDLLAEGYRGIKERFGEEVANRYFIQVKGLGSLQSDERPTPSFALGIAVATRGSDHLRSRPAIDLFNLPPDVLQKIMGFPVHTKYTEYEEKPRMVWWQEALYAVVDSLGLCKFQTVFLSPSMPQFNEWSKLLHLIAGIEMSPQQLFEAGERIYNVERMFNTREGASRKDDYLCDRYYDEPTPIGLDIARGKAIDRKKFDDMLDEYYQIHGWDVQGNPTPATLKKLGLDKEPSHRL